MPRNRLLLVALLIPVQIGGCPTLLEEQLVPGVRLETTAGTVTIELLPDAAPGAAVSFVEFVEAGTYAETSVHTVVQDTRVVAGGLDADLSVQPADPPVLETPAQPVSNVRGTVAFLPNPADFGFGNAAFYVNLTDSPELDPTPDAAGGVVFGEVISGLDLLDQIAAGPTQSLGGLTSVPDPLVRITSAELIDIGTGEIIPTEAGLLYFARQEFIILNTLRTIAVDLLGLGFGFLLPG